MLWRCGPSVADTPCSQSLQALRFITSIFIISQRIKLVELGLIEQRGEMENLYSRREIKDTKSWPVHAFGACVVCTIA